MITLADILAARNRLAPHLVATPLRSYRALDDVVGHDIRLLVKHENHQPTGSFKVRNGLSLMTGLSPAERACGVVAASTGNHGLGIGYAAAALGAQATICVPRGNNPEKNAAIRALGAELVEEGKDYDESVAVMQRIAAERGRTIAHSTNDPRVIAGAGTMTLEILEQADAGGIDAMILAVGGGSQSAGAITATRELAPRVRVYGVQAAGAPAVHDSWHAREKRSTERADTFAEGVATRSAYDATFPTLLEGLAGFITVTDAEIADSLRVILSATHNLVEGAGAMGLAAARKLAPELAGQCVAIAFCGGNMDTNMLRRILNREL